MSATERQIKTSTKLHFTEFGKSWVGRLDPDRRALAPGHQTTDFLDANGRWNHRNQIPKSTDHSKHHVDPEGNSRCFPYRTTTTKLIAICASSEI